MNGAPQYAIDLAFMVQTAAARREGSYDRKEADRVSEASAAEAQVAEAQGDMYAYLYRMVDYGKFYRLSLEDCCKMTCRSKPHMWYTVYLLLSNSWNESLEWAKHVTGLPVKVIPYDPQEIVPQDVIWS